MKKFFVSLLGFVILTSGCVAQKPLPRDNRSLETDQPQAQQQQDQAPVVDERNEALRLSNQVSKIEGVKNATVVLVENTAYVGLRLHNSNGTSATNQVQDQVTDTVLKQSPVVETVYVATHPETVARIEQIYLDIQAGRIASTFRDELQQIKVGGQ